ncbi:lipopolysaccharide biosynthesis protein [Enterococcus lactis]|uniref:lipopolysaccharide biosynthesis protein n=1 Tax=Enterococcus lactis TaxID=357441 RepID=UPI003D99C36A
MKNKSNKQLLTNTIVFGVGNIGTKLIGILLLPFYTAILTTAEYGIADIYTNTINLIMPIVSFSIYDAVLRYSLEEIDHREKLLSSGFKITLLGNGLIPLGAIILKITFLNNINVINLGLICFVISAQSFQQLLANYIRGIGQLKIYATSGLINAISAGISSYLFLYIVQFRIVGYLFSILIGNISTIFFLCFFIDLKTMLKNQIKRKDMIGLLQYSIPLVPNAILWWVLNGSNRYIIILFEGAEATGIFSVANKIPSIVTSIAAVFLQAWQITAIKDYQKNKKEYYNNIYKFYYTIVCVCVFITIIFLKPIVRILFDSSYYQSWMYTAPLLIGCLFLTLANFLGTHYLVAKCTKKIFTTSLIAALTNLTISILTIPMIGISGSVLGIVISYIVIFILRLKEIEVICGLGLSNKGLILMLPVYTIQLVFILIFDSEIHWYLLNSILSLYCIIIFYFIYKREAKTLKNM